jgi:hypothetical protein
MEVCFHRSFTSNSFSEKEDLSFRLSLKLPCSAESLNEVETTSNASLIRQELIGSCYKFVFCNGDNNVESSLSNNIFIPTAFIP